MAKESPTETLKSPPSATAVAEEEFMEIPVVDAEDEALLTEVGKPEERAEAAEEEVPEKKVEPEAKQAEPKPEQAKPKAEAKPEKARPPAAEKPEPELQRPLTPIERAEREKRKDYARKWQAAVEEQERLQARIAQLQQEVKVAEFKVGEAKIPEERLRALRERLKNVSELETVAEAAVHEAETLIQERDRQWQTALQERDKRWQEEAERQRRLNRINLSWLGARISHKDFDQVLRESGVLAEIAERADGTYSNLYLARRVYLHDDPGEEAYQLAVGRLEATRGNGQPQEGGESAEPPKAQAKPAKAEEPEETVEVEEAERRGARKVIEQVETIAKKPKGIAGLKSAGGPKTRWSKSELDALMRANPARYQELVGKYPDLERFHLS